MKRRSVLAAGGAALLGSLAFGTGQAVAAPAVLTRKAIFFDPDDPVLGNPKGTLPIAEFFDYRCTYCRGMHPMLESLIARNPDIRYVAKEWPVFGGPSITAARIALAARFQGKFAAANDALFRADLTGDAAAVDAVHAAGLDMKALERDLRDHAVEIEGALQTTALQAEALSLQGTPGFIIGDYLIPGALSAENLAHVVHDARAKLAKQRS